MEFTNELDSLKDISIRVSLVGSREVAELIDMIPSRILDYFNNIDGDDKIYAAKANSAMADVDALVSKLDAAVRKDIGVDEAKL